MRFYLSLRRLWAHDMSWSYLCRGNDEQTTTVISSFIIPETDNVWVTHKWILEPCFSVNKENKSYNLHLSGVMVVFMTNTTPQREYEHGWNGIKRELTTVAKLLFYNMQRLLSTCSVFFLVFWGFWWGKYVKLKPQKSFSIPMCVQSGIVQWSTGMSDMKFPDYFIP